MLNPQPTVKASTRGRNVPVVLRVVDKRSDTVIGYQTTQADGTQKNPITSAGDVSRVLCKKLADGLRRKGFETQAYSGPSKQKPRLTVTLDQLSYKQSGGDMSGKVHVAVELKAQAETAKQTYQATYSIGKNKRRALLHTRKENQQLINQALGSVLQSLLNDHKLIAALAGAEASRSGS